MIFTLLFSLLAYGGSCVQKNDTVNMCKGHSFMASEASGTCRKEIRYCLKEASVQCASGKPSKAECIQQYGGVWMTKCFCE